MKSLLVFSLLTIMSVHAQTTFNQSSPSTLGTGNFMGAGPTTLDQGGPIPLGDGMQNLERSNTAPTPIPDDTSLIFTPSNDPLRQAQEEKPLMMEPATVPGTTNEDSSLNNSGPIKTLPETVR